MNPAWLFWLAVIGTCLGSLCATAARVLFEFSRSEMEAYCKRRNREDRFVAIVRDHARCGLCAEGVQMISVSTMVICAGLYLYRLSWDETIDVRSLSYSILVGTFLLLFTNSWIPWAVVRYFSAPFLYHTWWLWKVLGVVGYPFYVGFEIVEDLFQRLTGDKEEDEQEEREEALEEEIRSIVTAGEKTGLLEHQAADMIEGVIELDDTTVGQIKTPISSVDAISHDIEWEELLDFVNQTHRSRIPVYEGTRDTIVGILLVKELFPELCKHEQDRPKSIERFLHKPHFVPDSNNLDEMLKHFLASREHMAVVMDEFNNVAGVVTIEDVLEEIVGEIVDESDPVSEPELQRIDKSTYRALGSARLDELNEELGVELPLDEDYDTISGFLMNRMRSIPRAGETIRLYDLEFEVEQGTRRKIGRVLIRMTQE